MYVTVFGTVTVFKLWQYEKRPVLMNFMPLGIATDSRLVQRENAKLSMYSTFQSMLIDFRFSHMSNA